uniref:TAZ-type domain-containing protein n=1 Tax=Haemonchus contortus TaxID=6289 RepID=A0A7I4Z4Y6_HAECO
LQEWLYYKHYQDKAFAMDIRVIDDTEELVMPEELKDLGEKQAVSRALGVLIHALLFHEPCVTPKPWERRRARPSCLQAAAMWSHMQVCSHCDELKHKEARLLIYHWIDCHSDRCYVCSPWIPPQRIGEQSYAFLKEVTGHYDEHEPLKTVLSDAFAERVARQLKAPHHFILDADTGNNKCAVEVQTDLSVFTDDIVHVFEAKVIVDPTCPHGLCMDENLDELFSDSETKSEDADHESQSPPHVCVFFAEPHLGVFDEDLSDYNKGKRHVGMQVDNMPRDCCMTCGKFDIHCDGENSSGKGKKGGRKGNKGGRRNKKSK